MFQFRNKTTLGIRLAALVITIFWSGFWIFFAFATMISEPFSAHGMLVTLVFFLFFATTVFFSWKYPKKGGIATVIVGVIVMVGYPILVPEGFPVGTTIFVILSMGLPPVISGILNILFSRRLLREEHVTSLDALRIG